MPHTSGRRSEAGAPPIHRRSSRRVARLLLTAAVCVAALAAAGSALADVSATASANSLSVSVSTPGPVLSGVTANYTVSVTNTSTAPISSVSALIDLPDGLTLKTAAANCVKNPLGGRSTLVAQCTFGVLAPGASASAVVGLLAPAPGTYTVNADGTYQAPLPSGFEIFNTPVSLSVPVAPGPADIQVTGSSNNGSPPVGQAFQYTFQVKDNGPQGAYGVTFDDTLPASLTLIGVSASIGTCSSVGNAVHCDVGGLATGQQSNIVVSAIATAAGAVTDTASIAMLGADTQPANNTVSVTVQPK